MLIETTSGRVRIDPKRVIYVTADKTTRGDWLVVVRVATGHNSSEAYLRI